MTDNQLMDGHKLRLQINHLEAVITKAQGDKIDFFKNVDECRIGAHAPNVDDINLNDFLPGYASVKQAFIRNVRKKIEELKRTYARI